MQIAFAEGRFCFTEQDGAPAVRILCPGIASTSLGAAFDAIFVNQLGYSPQSVPVHIRNMMFAEIDGKKLAAPKAPAMRCLSLHMQVAYSSAITKGWMEEGEEGFQDYGSEGGYGWKTWLEASAVAAECALAGEADAGE